MANHQLQAIRPISTDNYRSFKEYYIIHTENTKSVKVVLHLQVLDIKPFMFFFTLQLKVLK